MKLELIKTTYGVHYPFGNYLFVRFSFKLYATGFPAKNAQK